MKSLSRLPSKVLDQTYCSRTNDRFVVVVQRDGTAIVEDTRPEDKADTVVARGLTIDQASNKAKDLNNPTIPTVPTSGGANNTENK